MTDSLSYSNLLTAIAMSVGVVIVLGVLTVEVVRLLKKELKL